MLDWFAGAVASANAAKEIGQSLMALRDEELIRSKVFELTNSLMDLQQQMMTAQVEQMKLINNNTELQQQNEALKKQADLQERYVLHQFSVGTFAYTLRPEHRGAQPEHFLCCKCFERGMRTTMHNYRDEYSSTLHCPECKTSIGIEPSRPVPRKNSSWLIY